MERKERENEKYKKLITKNELDYQQFLQLKMKKKNLKKSGMIWQIFYQLLPDLSK